MRGRAARWVRWLGMATAIAVPTGATAFLVAGPASATDPTAHVTFTAKGVVQQDLTIKPGTDVVFANDVDPSQGVPILGTVTGLVRSVSITVTGATQKPFELQRNQEATVPAYTSGSKPFVIHYSATYQATDLLLNDPNTKTVTGTITVAASPPTSTGPTGPTSNPSSQPTTSAPTTAPTNQSSGSGSSSHASTAPHSQSPQTKSTIPGYRPPGPDVASQVVPKGDGGSYTSDGTADSTTSSSSPAKHSRTSSGTAHQSSTTRSSSAHTTTDVAAGDPVAPKAKNSANEQPLDTAASQTGALPSSFNWPAIAAVALLSTVAVALVRTFAAHRRGH